MNIEPSDTDDDAAAVAAQLSNTRSSTSLAGSGSAARQVFDLPELLENILLFVSKFAEPDSRVGHITHKNPAKYLFVLQRVNSTFRATISRNRQMQQRMFLESSPAEPTTDLHPYVAWESAHDFMRSPFQWLLNKVGVSDDVFQLHGSPAWLYTRGEVILPNKHISKSSEASWRNMKLHCVKGCGPIDLEYFTTADTWIHVGTFAESDSMTLGRLHDGLLGLMPLAHEYGIAEGHDALWGLSGDAAEHRLQKKFDTWQW